ncbi:MAG TPA: hypothetical protein VGF48_09110 [Thermoanaerobaculia bacterium]|jgi:hypothetical protein
MKSLFDATARASVISRVRRLTSDAERLWGTMTPAAAVTHLADQLRVAFGEIVRSSPPRVLSYWPLNYLAIYVIPWAKGKGKAAPETLSTKPLNWDADQAALITLIERFSSSEPDSQWPADPVFGSLSGRAWGVLCYKHVDYHLRQFGC